MFLCSDEVDPNELDLSFTERQAYKHQLKQSKINNINNFAPPIAYEIWNSPPEVYDRIYGFEVDCEPPDRHNISWNWLYKLWGYYTQKEIRHRCSLYTFMKAQRRCQNNQFWDTFDLENTFRVEIQLLCLHLWIAKTRILMFDYKSAQKLSYKTFKCFFDQLPNRFNKNKHGLKSGWIKDCQQACIHFAISLDNAFDDYNNGDNESFGKVIWNELYLSNNDIEHDLLYLWSQYILINIKHLKFNVDDNCFYNGWWKFQNIPTNNDRQNIRNIIINNYNNNNDINIFDNLRDFLNNHNNNDITNNNNHSIS